MIIALDYDDTYTADKPLWNKFIHNSFDSGHTVTFVTYRDSRHGNHDIEYDAELLKMDIVYTAGKQKQHCFVADIWIDDSPETVVNYNNLVAYKVGCEVNADYA